jgi:hypothetical protein
LPRSCNSKGTTWHCQADRGISASPEVSYQTEAELVFERHPWFAARLAAIAGQKKGFHVNRPRTIGIDPRRGEKILQAKRVRFLGPVHEGKSGSFVAFEDPDGNSLYLAQLNWDHVEQGEGEYQTAAR